MPGTMARLTGALRPRFTPITRRRWRNFKAHRRGYWSLWIFAGLYLISLFAVLIANDRPILMRHEGTLYVPALVTYPETTFGGAFRTEADYKNPVVQELVRKGGGWMIFPIIPYSYDTIDYDLEGANPSGLSRRHWLGTDDQGRDVLARIIYGFRLSVTFGFILTFASAVIGVVSGAIQGYFGGMLDLTFQRVIEILVSLPTIYLLIILGAMAEPGFWTLLCFLLIFSWMALVPMVRAEFLRARNLDYVRAAHGLGLSSRAIMFKHILPNAMVATLTFLPFILNASITTLTALDFLGFGLPRGSPSLGELLSQAKNNLQAPWLAIAGFAVMTVMLSLLVFIGEALRDAFDPRKTS